MQSIRQKFNNRAISISPGKTLWLVVILLNLVQPAIAGTPLYDGLLSHWALDEDLGNTAFDSAPSGVVQDNGLLRNNPTWTDGIFGAGLQFDGTNQSVLIPSSLDMDIGANAVTLSAWVKLDQLPQDLPSSFSGIFDSQPDSYVLYLDRGNNELRFKVTTETGAAARPGVSASMLTTDSWLHVMGVYDGQGSASLYYNGDLAGVLESAGLTSKVRTGQTAGIGSQVATGFPYEASSNFQGGIADVAVWNRPLGLAEARYLYNQGSGNAIGAANPSIEPIVVEPPDPSDNAPIAVVAHRGYSAIAPENTLSAFTAAAGFASYVEFDVRRSRDNQLVVMHDSTIDRTTNGSGAVSTLNYEGDLDGLDAGGWFSADFIGEGVPTMADALQTISVSGMKPFIERKTGDASDYVTELDNLGALDDSVIIAFDWEFLSEVRALDSDVRLGGLGSGTLDDTVIDDALAAGLDFINWRDGNALDPAAISQVHAAGLELHVYTVDNLVRMQQLIDLEVDGITTNNPEGLRSIVPFATPPGDYSGDGIVDAADYTVWRDTQGDPAGYDTWTNNYGNTAPTNAGTVQAAHNLVPEPTTLPLGLTTLAAIIAWHKEVNRSACG